MNDSPHQPRVAPVDRATNRAAAERTLPHEALDSAALLQGGKAVTIHHKGELYRLQATRQGKLILTK
ncbi:MAG: hemin uptake protein HemP [Hylemonella sp.]|nr:hemin uptake protein HemP [Hylemonella sp.]